MDTTTINQTFDLLSLAERDTELKRSGKYLIGPCPFCGGTDRFQIKQTNDGYLWICRKCGTGKYQDSIAYVARHENLDLHKDFSEVIRRMGFTLDALPQVQRPAPAPSPLVIFPPDDWQKETFAEIDSASYALLHSPDGKAARFYLIRRGLSLGTINTWDLGYTVRHNRPAIVIPHIERTPNAEKVLAVKYRFIDELARLDHNKRFLFRPGSHFALYGLWQVLDSDNLLILCEGEVNLQSLWQVNITGASVVSFGSQTVTEAQLTLARTLASRYPNVLVWMDEPLEGQKVVSALQHLRVKQLKSPVKDGKKFDANTLLQENLLSSFLAETIGRTCQAPDLQNKPLTALSQIVTSHSVTDYQVYKTNRS